MMNGHMAAGLVAYGMTEALFSTARALRESNERRAQEAALHAWSGALEEAEGSADDMATVAIAAIQRVAELEAEVSKLHRAVRYRDEAIARLS